MTLISLQELRYLVSQALSKLSYSSKDVDIITDVIMYAELRANNQGVIKLISGALNPHPSSSTEIEIVHDTPVSCRINGHQKSGMVVVHESVEIALKKASQTGLSIVGCSGYSSATGALGYWAKKITDSGYIGIVMSQCNELMAPHGSYEPIFGTNPIAIGIPTQPRPQILDMATSACAYYGIKLAEQTGQSIPNDIAYDNQGNPTTNPTEALRGAIRVFDRSYKGSHLALMIELLAGAFTGASMENKLASENWGSLVLVIRPDILGDKDQFLASASTMCDRVKHAKPLPELQGKESYLPGERGDLLEQEHLSHGNLEIDENILQQLQAMIHST